MQLFEVSDALNQPYEVYLSDTIEFPLHCHYYSEILYIKSGSIRITCNAKSKVLRAGDLCYFYPLQLHEISPTEDKVVEYTIVKFDFHTLTLPPAHQAKLYDYFIHRLSTDDFCIIIPKDELSQEICRKHGMDIDNYLLCEIEPDDFYNDIGWRDECYLRMMHFDRELYNSPCGIKWITDVGWKFDREHYENCMAYLKKAYNIDA